jgi:aspartate/methionine/tyrosine aminotransferase
MAIANYTIQEWLFNTAHGKYELDLAESGVQFQHFGDITFKPEWEMDYSQDKGNEALREEVIKMYGGNITLDQCLISHGAQEALYLFYRSFLAAGDHIITTIPGWQQSWEVPKHIGCDTSLHLWQPGAAFDIEGLEALVQDNTKLLVINSPCNPTGSQLTNSEWLRLIEVAEKHDLWIINDEEYLLDFGDSIVHKYSKSLSVSSLSKVYGLPALRLGWAISRNDMIADMINYKRYTTVCNSLVCEYAGTEVIAQRQKHIARYQSIIDTALPILLEFAELAKDYMTLVPPQNTPFSWLNLTMEESSEAFVTRLLDEQKLLVMCAEVFGTTKGIRVTYARDPDILKAGLNRILAALGIEATL